MKIFYSCVFLLFMLQIAFAKDKIFIVNSPDKKNKIEIIAGEKIHYRLLRNNTEILGPSPISLTLYDGKVLGKSAVFQKQATKTINTIVKPLYWTNVEIKENYNELTLSFSENFDLIFRVYNEGIAYRFVTRLPGKIKIKDEEVNYNFPGNPNGYFSRIKDKNTMNSYEVHYEKMKISDLDSGFSYLPLLIDNKNLKLLISESDLLDYPGLNFESDGKNTLKGYLPQVVISTKVFGWNNGTQFVPYDLLPEKRQDYIAETNGTRAFPWRMMVVAESDKDLINQSLVYLLSSENKIQNTSWIKPGKVAWDWWASVNLSGVNFKTGYNTETFKYFIDFAAKNNIPYVNIDEGWSNGWDDLLHTNNKLDMQEVIRYAKEKKIGLFLWCIWHSLDKQLIPALDLFQKWEIAGIKVDFMDRDDQEVVNFYERVASEAAKRHILVNFHGANKPSGLERTYPNVVNRESVQGLEYNKFTNKVTPEHAAHIPFIRMAVGGMDYTPGAMTNSNKNDFRAINDRPMSQGTRCQQLAMYVIYYAPLEMMADSPSAYEKEPEILEFLAQTPTTWDQSIALDGKLGDYIAMARKKGNNWYVGALTDWDRRSIEIDFSFLGEGNYNAEIFQDGINADRIGNDYKKITKKITKGDKIKIEMAPGGGWAAKITPAN